MFLLINFWAAKVDPARPAGLHWAAKVDPVRPAGLHWAAKVGPARPAGLHWAAKVGPVRPVGPPIILAGLFLKLLLFLNYLSCRNWQKKLVRLTMRVCGIMPLIHFSETLGSG